ncbi:MAG: hypothetical protein ABI217_08580 [Chthoniobacterales bacterium]
MKNVISGLLPYRRHDSQSASAGFSMIELALAIGVFGFCLLAVVGLLPIGMKTQRASQEQSRAGSALDMVYSAAQSLRFTDRSSGHPTWAFPSYFSNSSSAFLVWVSQGQYNYTFFVGDGGLIIPDSDTTTQRKQTLYVKVFPPQIEGQPVQIYAALAWPYKPTDNNTTTPDQMTGREGFLDTFVAFNPKATL